MPPMGTGLPHEDGRVNAATIAYYRRRAAGGVGMICVEASLVAPAIIGLGPEIRLHGEEFVPGLAALAESVHDEGIPVGVQLWHPGRQTTLGSPVGPSAVPLSKRTPVPHALSRDEIHEVTAWFALSAGFAREAGFDFVELHAAHCYLPCEFMSPLANQRDDDYGGELTNRARFMLELVAAIRATCGPEFPLFVRLSGEEGVPGGFTIDDAVVVAQWLVEAGISCISVSAGSWHALNLTVPPMSMERGCLVPFAARIKRAVPVPVITAGRLDDVAFAQAVLAAGDADLVAVGRGLIADPDWPAKAREGRFRDIRPCISCNACLDLVARAEVGRCAVNPEVSREAEWRVSPAELARRVMVVGSGPAGMEAARLAHVRGHHVSLWERNPELGGKLDVASRAPSKTEVLRFRDYQVRVLDELGVEIHTGVEVTPAVVDDVAPDVVVVATGADPLIPPIPGIGGPNVIDAQDILLGRIRIEPGERIAIVGGSATGCETAEFLLTTASELSIFEMLPQVGRGIELITRQQLLRELRAHDVAVLTGHKVLMIAPGKVFFETADGEGVLDVDRVALAIGWRSRGNLLAEGLKERYEVVVLGDADRPGDFVAAINAGADAGLCV
jgi:2,4-dienoyl-CoA reductase-like NADH-dependent reductase (Old Yellow Enzyme family)/NADPH-dependent 2,4-dienoyl-CoA reductase/sulfur reductase-like enzyme